MVVVDRFIYALGGRLGKRCLDAVDVYDPMNNHWNAGQPMTMRRSSAGAVLYKDYIYAVGGFTEANCETATVERYDGYEWKMVIQEPKILITNCLTETDRHVPS